MARDRNIAIKNFDLSTSINPVCTLTPRLVELKTNQTAALKRGGLALLSRISYRANSPVIYFAALDTFYCTRSLQSLLLFPRQGNFA